MANNFKSIISRQCNENMLLQLMRIRKQHYYQNAYNENYWGGGIQILLNDASLTKAHEEDFSSKFLFIFGDNDELVAYSRYSLNQKTIDNYKISKLHILAADKKIIGIEHLIDGQKIKIGDFILNKVISECKEHNSDILVSEICVYPLPNLPSLNLHKQMGFEPISNSLKYVPRVDGVINSFIILGKHLNIKSEKIFETEVFK